MPWHTSLVLGLVATALSSTIPRHSTRDSPLNLDIAIDLDLNLPLNLDINLDLGLNIDLLPGYTLTFHDEFTYTPSPSPLPSSSNWLIDLGTSYPGGAPHWGNNENETYTSSPSNIALTPSNTLTITPRHINNKWTSARIETRDTFTATPGGKLFIESRLKTGCAPSENQQGIWPAFWALGSSFRGNYTNWPMASEWDFVEVINGLDTVYNTVHCGSAPGGPCNEYDGLGNGGVSWSGCEWHWVGFEVDRSMCPLDLLGLGTWRDEKLRWFLDGRLVHEVSGGDVGDEAAWKSLAHQGHFLLLNVAVGGNWPGQPNASTVDGEGVRMEVDFVRVWNLY